MQPSREAAGQIELAPVGGLRDVRGISIGQTATHRLHRRRWRAWVARPPLPIEQYPRRTGVYRRFAVGQRCPSSPPAISLAACSAPACGDAVVNDADAHPEVGRLAHRVPDTVTTRVSVGMPVDRVSERPPYPRS